MNKDFFKGLAVGVGIAGLAAVAGTRCRKGSQRLAAAEIVTMRLRGRSAAGGDRDDDTDYMAGSPSARKP